VSEREPFSWAARARSFGFAFRGVVTLLATQHNAWIHAAATVAVVALGVALGVSRLEWALLIFAIALVWTAEGLNTALEWLCDVAAPEYNPLVKKAKDVAAAAVLLAAIGSALIGLLVFGPRLLVLLGW
jgi:diacylglycerol kinase (ATP)